MEEVAYVLSHGLAHDGLQFMGPCVVQLVDTGVVLEQGHCFDHPYSRDLLNQGHDQGVQQPRHTPPEERVVFTLSVYLQRRGHNSSVNRHAQLDHGRSDCMLVRV